MGRKKIKLEVGKTYVTRVGKKIKIINMTGSNIYPFLSEQGAYAENGRFSHLVPCDNDIIAETN